MFAQWLICISVFIQVSHSAYFPSCSEQDEIVKRHNERRATVEAKYMLKLRYNKTLADQAGVWADKCNFAHSDLFIPSYGDVGQNLWAISESMFSSWRQPIDAWANEVTNYTYGPFDDAATCKQGAQCTHYTQLVWAKSAEVGCAFRRCPSLTYQGSTGLDMCAVACVYYPAGNVRGALPYTPGQKLTDCPPEYPLKTDGLCSNNNTDKFVCTPGGKGLPCSARFSTQISLITISVLPLLAWLLN